MGAEDHERSCASAANASSLDRACSLSRLHSVLFNTPLAIEFCTRDVSRRLAISMNFKQSTEVKSSAVLLPS